VLPFGSKAFDERLAEGGLALGALWPAVVRVGLPMHAPVLGSLRGPASAGCGA
jgi:hypothetical protein